MNLQDGAKVAIVKCMRVRKGEIVLIVTDTEKERIGRALFDAARNAGAESLMMIMKPRKQHGVEPPIPLAKAMAASDVVLAPTAKSLTHTRARHQACKAGARVATLPGITEKMMSEGGMTADYDEVQAQVKAMAKKLHGAKEAVVKSTNGTNLTFDISDRQWHEDTGICENPGEMTNLPAGELYIAPRSASGRLVVDGAMAGLGLLKFPLTLEIEEGKVVKFEGERAEELEQIVQEAGESGKNVAELGIGLNPTAKLIGETLQDEKVSGTIHVAIGDNSTFGGDVESEIHLDGIITQDPKLFIDGKEVQLPTSSTF